MAFFDNLMISLKQKWLQFFHANRSWIARHMEVEFVYTPDGGRRPPSYLILGVVNALEPQLAELMLPFSKLNPDVDTLIDVLELNFDPDLILGNSFNPQAVLDELDDNTAPNLLVVLEPDELSDVSLDEMADEVVLVETDDESLVLLSEDEAAALTDISLDEMVYGVVPMETDRESVVPSPERPNTFGDMSLDEIASVMGLESDDESLETPSDAQPNESGDLSSDVWDEGTSSESKQAKDETHLGDEKQSGQDPEISRLFPNS